MKITKELIKTLLKRYSNVGGNNWLENVENYEDQIRLAVLWEQIACIMLEGTYTGTFESIVFELAKEVVLKTKVVYDAKEFVEFFYSRYNKIMKEHPEEVLEFPFNKLLTEVKASVDNCLIIENNYIPIDMDLSASLFIYCNPNLNADYIEDEKYDKDKQKAILDSKQRKNSIQNMENKGFIEQLLEKENVTFISVDDPLYIQGYYKGILVEWLERYCKPSDFLKLADNKLSHQKKDCKQQILIKSINVQTKEQYYITYCVLGNFDGIKAFNSEDYIDYKNEQINFTYFKNSIHLDYYLEQIKNQMVYDLADSKKKYELNQQKIQLNANDAMAHIIKEDKNIRRY